MGPTQGRTEWVPGTLLGGKIAEAEVPRLRMREAKPAPPDMSYCRCASLQL